MDKEVQEYLLGRARLLGGQLRGAINQKARKENLELINITFLDIYETAFGLGELSQNQKESLEKLKQELKPDNNDSGTKNSS